MMAWPAVLKPINGSFAPFVRSLSGGQSLSGFEQVQPQLHDRWGAEFMFAVRNSEQLLAMRSMLTALRGRAGTISVPSFFDRARERAPWPDNAYDAPLTPNYLRRKRLDESSFADTQNLYDGLIIAQLVAPAAINATTVSVFIVRGGTPRPGQRFSIGSRLYEITAATLASGTTYTLAIWPWLRAAAGTLESVNFSSPVCEMRLASDGEGVDALRSLTLGRFADVTLQFDEVAA